MFHDKICERHEVIVIDKQISTSAKKNLFVPCDNTTQY